MPPGANSGGQDPPARALRALERGATSWGIQIARSVHDRWRRMPAQRRAKLEGFAASVRQQAHAPRGEPDLRVAVDPDVSKIEVRDLRAELALELEQLAAADIEASRGSGKLAGETPSSD